MSMTEAPGFIMSIMLEVGVRSFWREVWSWKACFQNGSLGAEVCPGKAVCQRRRRKMMER